VPAGANSLTGTVVNAAYLGVSTQYVIELKDGHKMTVYEQNVERATRAELWERGEEVLLTWSPDHSFVVPAEGPAAREDGDEEAAEAEIATPTA
jgi:spermidine/putrescine transport system ATP-binding protein